TFPICRSHFGLHEQVLGCERAIHQFCSADRGHRFHMEHMISWLRKNHETKSGDGHLDTTKDIVLPALDQLTVEPLELAQALESNISSLPETPATPEPASAQTTSDCRSRSAIRRPPRLRLETSSFLKEPGSDPVSGQPFSPLSGVEYKPFVQSRSHSRN